MPEKSSSKSSSKHSIEPEVQVVRSKFQLIFTIVFTALFTVIFTIGGTLTWVAYTRGDLSDGARYELTKQEILRYVDEQSIREVPDLNKQREGELRGLVSSLEDPYSSYLSEEDEAEFQNSLNQRYEGIGVRFDEREEGLIVDKVFDGSPAQQASVLENDILIEVEGENIVGLRVGEVAEQIRGPEGTQVRLRFVRDDQEQDEKTLTRAPIDGDMIFLDIRDGIAIIEITTFGIGLAEEMAVIAQEVLDADVRGIVLDLQGNSGGLLDQSIKVLSYFVEPNTVVVREETVEGELVLRSEAVSQSLQSLPLAITIDGRSASASEIMAGALRDIRGVELYGETTFGKGTVQRLFDLTEGKLRLTIAEWFTPNGSKIEEVGLEPDVEVAEDKDAVEVALQSFENSVE
jgi:carboxyl-terminal processing protease